MQLFRTLSKNTQGIEQTGASRVYDSVPGATYERLPRPPDEAERAQHRDAADAQRGDREEDVDVRSDGAARLGTRSPD